MSEIRQNELNEVASLKKQLQIHVYRTLILRFKVLCQRYNCRLRVLLNDRKEFHLNDCEWSWKNATLGPDTCSCSNAIRFPEEYFSFSVEKETPSNCPLSSDFYPIFRHYKDYHPEAEEESIDDFYLYRVSDFENVSKWYELYKAKHDALSFQVKIRELRRESEIDAIYNSRSKEWHLTDCERSVNWQLGAHVCHCRKAMMDPWKYLKGRYRYVNFEKFSQRVKEKKYPKNYTRENRQQ